MPTYDYECNACGHHFEAFQKMTDEPLKQCPSCAKRSVRRLLGTGAGVLFKGGGFYQTDYRSESYRKAVAKESSPCAAGGGDCSKCEKKTEPVK